MIIRRQQDALIFIEQADHARMAADILSDWQADGFPSNPRREAILLAALEHDNGWREEDASTHVDGTGDPLDFISVPAAVKHRIWPRAATRLADTDPYAGALVAEHALSLHGQQRADPAWRAFLDRMERLKQEILARCETSAADTLGPDYVFVRTVDQLSLIFCNAWTAPFPRPGGRTILKGTTLELTPDPFEGRTIDLKVRARRLPVRTFASPAVLRQALDAAADEYLEGAAIGAH